LRDFAGRIVVTVTDVGGHGRSGLNECAPHRQRRRWKIAHDEFCLEPHHAISGALELAIAARIRAHAQRVITAINLDDEARARRVEVRDETEERDLPPKGDAKLARAQCAPEPSL